MDWDLTLEKLRREAFRPTVPPPVRMPRWAVAALLGAGLTLSGAACDRGGGDSDTASNMGRVHVEYGAPMPPEMAEEPMQPMPEVALYAAPPPENPRAMEVPPQVEEYRAPPVDESSGYPPPPEMTAEPVDMSANVPAYGMPMGEDMLIGKPRTRPKPKPVPPPQTMYGGPDVDDW